MNIHQTNNKTNRRKRAARRTAMLVVGLSLLSLSLAGAVAYLSAYTVEELKAGAGSFFRSIALLPPDTSDTPHEPIVGEANMVSAGNVRRPKAPDDEPILDDLVKRNPVATSYGVAGVESLSARQYAQNRRSGALGASGGRAFGEGALLGGRSGSRNSVAAGASGGMSAAVGGTSALQGVLGTQGSNSSLTMGGSNGDVDFGNGGGLDHGGAYNDVPVGDGGWLLLIFALGYLLLRRRRRAAQLPAGA